MVGCLVATRDFNGANISFRVGGVLKWVDDNMERFPTHPRGKEELVPKEYCKPVAALDEKAFQE
jgi:hypothetical protein